MKSTNSFPEEPGGKVPEISREGTGETRAARRPYRPPSVTAHGSMVRIALGGTPGSGDSGMPTLQQVDS